MQVRPTTTNQNVIVNLNVKDRYDTLAQLNTDYPTGSQYAFAVGTPQSNEIYVWNGTQWRSLGSIKGASGTAGQQGIPGEQGEPGETGAKGDTGSGLDFLWNDTSLGVKKDTNTIYSYVDLKGEQGEQGIQGVQGEQGIQGIQGRAIEFDWNGTQLGIRPEGESLYTYVDLQGVQGIQGIQGIKGDQGVQGIQGVQGKSLEFLWNGTQLGVRVEGNPTYTYVDLKGVKGDKGDTGNTGATGATGATGSTGATGVGLQFSWNGTQLGIKREDQGTYSYIDLKGAKGDTGAQGIQGATGATGAKGDQGIQGIPGIQGIQGVQGIQGKSMQYNWNGTQLGVRVEGDVSYTYVDLKGTTGATGNTGSTGATGRGITNVALTSGTHAPGTTDTYTVTYSDATTSTFTVYNGANGEGSGDMNMGVYDTDLDGIVERADTADKLTTARTINGVSFDGSVDITIADDTKEPLHAVSSGSYFWRGDRTWAGISSTVRGVALAGLVTTSNAIITTADTILTAFGKLQKQISDNLTTLTTHIADAVAHITSAERTSWNDAVTSSHSAVTVTDSSSINLTLTGQDVTASTIFGTASGTVCQGNDSRLSDARTPLGHIHVEGDVVGLAANLAGKEPAITKNTAFNKNYETTATNIKMNGTQAVGTADTIARGDHVHPTDIGRAASVHTHIESDIVNLTTDLAGKAASSHTHGNITNAGAIGSTSGLPVVTGTSGVLQAGSFGTTAGTICQGNDSRLSDTRLPKDGGTITQANLNTTTVSGFYNFLDSAGTFGTANGLWNLEVINSTYGANASIIQRITQTYTGTAKEYIRTYYTALGVWSAWKQTFTTDGGTITGQLLIDVTGDASLTSTGHAFQVGASNVLNIICDQNEIMARNNGVASGLNLNADGGAVNINGNAAYHMGNLTNGDAVVSGTLANGSIYMEW